MTYVLSALLAGVCGILLSGFSGGAALNMGEEFLLASIAVVVIGGTSVADKERIFNVAKSLFRKLCLGR